MFDAKIFQKLVNSSIEYNSLQMLYNLQNNVWVNKLKLKASVNGTKCIYKIQGARFDLKTM